MEQLIIKRPYICTCGHYHCKCWQSNLREMHFKVGEQKMKNEPIQITQWIDLEGCYHNSKEEASRSNHDLHLLFRKYIEEELLVTFSDGCYDRSGTTNNIWQMLEFTPECIKKIIKIMKENK